MPTVYLTIPRMKASLTGERLEIAVPPGIQSALPERRWIPLLDVELVVVDASVSLSMRTLHGLLRREIPVILLAHGNFPSGVAMPFTRQVTSLASQIDAVRDRDFRLACARALIFSKISNQKRLLQRLASNRSIGLTVTRWLARMAEQAAVATSIDSLRGIEGAAAGRYFEAFGQFFPDSTPFRGRNRRPPRDPPNALLSFIYTLLASEWGLHLRAAGLELGWGFYHEAEDGRPALALDFLESFRAPVADALTLDLLNRRILKPEDFDTGEDGACLLRPEARRKLFAALENRLEREFTYEATGQRMTLRRWMVESASKFRKACFQRSTPDFFLMN